MIVASTTAIIKMDGSLLEHIGGHNHAKVVGGSDSELGAVIFYYDEI